jgi:hypothetical protein
MPRPSRSKPAEPTDETPIDPDGDVDAPGYGTQSEPLDSVEREIAAAERAEDTAETPEAAAEAAALAAFKAQCEADVRAMQAAAAPGEDDEGPAPSGVYHRDWWRPSVVPPKPEAVQPLTVLLLAAELGEGQPIHSSVLWDYMQRQVVEQSLPWLRAAGWIALEGGTIRILRTPPRRP